MVASAGAGLTKKRVGQTGVPVDGVGKGGGGRGGGRPARQPIAFFVGGHSGGLCHGARARKATHLDLVRLCGGEAAAATVAVNDTTVGCLVDTAGAPAAPPRRGGGGVQPRPSGGPSGAHRPAAAAASIGHYLKDGRRSVFSGRHTNYSKRDPISHCTSLWKVGAGGRGHAHLPAPQTRSRQRCVAPTWRRASRATATRGVAPPGGGGRGPPPS